jgi:uncharacterized protein (DUF1015 family)
VADIRPFRAFRPPTALAAKVASPPYDVVTTAEARALTSGNPLSFLHVSRPEVDLPAGTDEHAAAVYEKGAQNLTALIAQGALVQDPEAHLYLYAQRMGAHHQIGVVACVSVADYLSESIKKHEKTRPDKEDDRVRHMEALAAHDEPVFLTYRAEASIDALVKASLDVPPALSMTTDDGVQHRVWVLGRATTRELLDAFSTVPALYVADGHHRSAAASRVHEGLRGSGGEHDVFMAVVFPHDQMQILAYNRIVRDLQRRSTETLLAQLGAALDLEPAASAESATPRVAKSFGIYLAGRWYRASVKPGSFDESDVVASLDCSLCQDLILRPLFGVTDPRRDRHVEFVGGIRGATALERAVDGGEFTMAIHLHPTSISELIAVSDAGLLMPPKSTWFEPKLKSGLFVHTF